MIRKDGLIPTLDEMHTLFGTWQLEMIQTHVAMPRFPQFLGSVVVFRNIGDYNDIRSQMIRAHLLVGMYRLMAKY